MSSQDGSDPPNGPDQEAGALRASPERLRAHVEALEGERHRDVPGSTEPAMAYVVEELGRAIGTGDSPPATDPLPAGAASSAAPALEPFIFEGETFHNAVLRIPGSDPSAPRILIGAHVDTVRGSPGADDNASGVAGVLECARLLGARVGRRATIELAVFDLEEQQLYTYRVGSRKYVNRARRAGVRYAGALIFEMIGYTSAVPGSQRIPMPLRWMDIPDTGDFIAVAGDGKSRRLVEGFEKAAADAAGTDRDPGRGGDGRPGIDVVGVTVPLRGWTVWQSRLSDNASFWSGGYPAVMITDTAFLRNPNYHSARDRSDTLDYEFMARVVDATVLCAKRLAGGDPASR